MRRSGRTVDEVREHNADGDHDLEHARDAAPDVFGTALRHERGRDGGDRADAQPRDDPPRVDEPQAA